MHSPALLDHFENPRNAGELPPPAVAVTVSNPVCGDILRLSALWRNGRVEESRFMAKGCTACVAMGSVVTELVLGCGLKELAAVGRGEIDSALGGLAAESKHVAVLGQDAIEALLKRLLEA
jgi:nitrogen fixation NifU-like protein